MAQRTIKFRAWDAVNKEIIYERIDPFNGLSSGQILTRYENVMQFTGLSDKNGVEIYEGDIVRCCFKMGDDGEYCTDANFKVSIGNDGVWLRFVSMSTDEPKNQYPISQTMTFGKGLRTDGRNDHYDRIAIDNSYYTGSTGKRFSENHYSNDVTIVGNIHQHSHLLT